MSRSGKTENKTAENKTVAFRMPLPLYELMMKYVKADTHISDDEFIRQAIREKLQRDAPDLYKEFIKEKLEV